MKLPKKVIAVILALVIGLSVCLSTAAATTDIQTSRPQFMSLSEYKQKLWDEGIPVFTTENFLNITQLFGTVYRFLTGQWFLPQSDFNVTVDEFLTEACGYIYENSGLDIVAILTSLPETNQYAELAVKTFEIDPVEFRNQMYDKRDEYWEAGDSFLSNVYYFIGAYMSIIDKCEVYSEPTEEDPAVYQVMLRLTFRDGAQEILKPGIFINTVTGECTNSNDSGLVGTGFNFSLSEMMVYATINCWMREFGFSLFYDVAAGSMPLLWNYITRRFKFDYNGLEWMIQIWKGNYLITNGGEVGVYNRTSDKFGTFYECATDEQLMEMTLQIYHGEELLVNQEPQMHWWINGFNMGDTMYLPASLTMKFSIVMPDEEMLNAFCESIDNHYRHDVTYTVEGLKVSVVW